MTHKPTQPARMSGRNQAPGTVETTAFAKARDKRRRARDLAKASRKRNR